MLDPTFVASAITHQVYGTSRRLIARPTGPAGNVDGSPRDRGAVSLEQVLWFVAAGVSVAVIAAILWSQIRDKAETEPVVPVAP